MIDSTISQNYNNAVFITYLLQAADGAGFSHKGPVHAVHPPVNTEVRPADYHVGGHLNDRTNQEQ